MLNYFWNNLWLTLGALLVLQLLDYYLTLAGARAYRAQTHYISEGSYELTPAYQRDIDALRKVSPRFLRGCAITLLMVTFVWWMLHSDWHHSKAAPQADAQILFECIIGMFFTIYGVVITRHCLNIYFFRRLARPGMAQGQMTVGASTKYAASGIMLLLSSALCLCLLALTYRSFFFGGFVMLAAIGAMHVSLGNQAQRRADAIAAGQEPPPERSPGSMRPAFKAALWLMIFLLFFAIFMRLSRDQDDQNMNRRRPAPVKLSR